MFSVKWDERFLALAEHIGGWSKDPSTGVGAAVVRPDKTIVSVGFNGFPRGTSDNPVLYQDRAEKLGRTVHAESNAILVARESLAGCCIFVAAPPCEHCAGHIIQAGITRVVYRKQTDEFNERWRESLERAGSMLGQAGVEAVAYA